MHGCDGETLMVPPAQIAPPFGADEAFVSLPERLRSLAVSHPDTTAVIDGETRFTFSDLVDRMDRIANVLTRRRIQPNSVVATCAGVTADHLCMMLGIVAHGSAIAFLPTSAGEDALHRMINNSDAGLVVADGTAPSSLAAVPIRTIMEESQGVPPTAPHRIAPDTAFAIIYSSGTTGEPKGIEHDALFRDRQIRRLSPFGFGPGAVSLVSTPLYSNTTLSGLLPAIANGSTVVMLNKFDEKSFLELSERHRVTHAMIVPAQARRLLAWPDFETYDLSAYQVKLSTSAPYTPALLREILDRWPGRMVNVYGMTEGGVTAMLDAGAHPDKLNTVGRASIGAVLRVIDQDGAPVPPGETGEIVGRAPTMMRGYRSAPELTAAALWFSDEGEAYIRSGDIGRMDDDGFLTLLDRKKDVIISGGFNVFACDIEAILETHPNVRDAAVVGVPHDRWGETPVAFVSCDRKSETEEIKDWTNSRLGKLQRLSGVYVVPQLPRSSIGKILKRELRETWERDHADV